MIDLKNTYIDCRGMSADKRMIYIKACIGDDLPHEKICGYGVHSKEELLLSYKVKANYIYLSNDGMLTYSDSNWPNLIGNPKEIKLKDLVKNPRTKTVYEKVDPNYDDGKYWECARDFAEGDCEFFYLNLVYKPIECNETLLNRYKDKNLYRRVEKDIDWKDELAEKAGLVYNKASDSFYMGGHWDANWVKEFGHLVASLTDKPE